MIGTWIRHNQGLFAALLLAAGVLVWTYGCESKVGSLVQPDKLVTREELLIEIDQESKRLENELALLQQKAELKLQQLDRQDELKRKLYDLAALTAETGQVNPAGVVTLIGSILGAGLLVDNRIKDKVIKNRPLP